MASAVGVLPAPLVAFIFGVLRCGEAPPRLDQALVHAGDICTRGGDDRAADGGCDRGEVRLEVIGSADERRASRAAALGLRILVYVRSGHAPTSLSRRCTPPYTGPAPLHAGDRAFTTEVVLVGRECVGVELGVYTYLALLKANVRLVLIGRRSMLLQRGRETRVRPLYPLLLCGGRWWKCEGRWSLGCGVWRGFVQIECG
ncbi:hypothetical protein B0H17DRAFT_680074 [Mycena rosella]|uniref:Uncharacterized protein n=1 Tax=Mycena rosella TaxID=1033263 RepID=A0AAD7DC11_MYCRO|nr:hypothetical protein B0H17DRAFT_680074 [Mycena rosella]